MSAAVWNRPTPAWRSALAPIITIAAASWAMLLGSVAVSYAQQSPPQPLTLHAALTYARQHSPRLAAARQGVTTGEAGVGAATAQRWPALDVVGAYSVAGSPTQTAVGFPLGGPGEVPARQAASRDHLNAGAYVTVPIYQGGRISAASHLAVAERDLAGARERDVERVLDFDVTRTYARSVELERDVSAAEHSVEALEESRRVIAQMLTVGKRPRVDLLKVDTRLADVRAQLITFRNAQRIEAGRLNALMGRPVDTPIVVQEELPRPKVAASMEEAVQAALRENTEYQLSQQRVQVAGRGVEVAKAQLRPSLSLAAGYRSQSTDPFSRNYEASPVAGVVLSFPAFDRSRSLRVDESESRERERRTELAQLRLDVEEQAQTAYLEVQDAEERIGATQTAIAFADEALRIEQEKQRLGRGTIEDLLDAQAALLTSQANYYRALADDVAAVAALERVTGLHLIGMEQSK